MVDVIVFNNSNIVTFLKMIIFYTYACYGTAIRVIVNLKVNQVACGSLASTASDIERENVNDAFFGPPVGSS